MRKSYDLSQNLNLSKHGTHGGRAGEYFGGVVLVGLFVGGSIDLSKK